MDHARNVAAARLHEAGDALETSEEVVEFNRTPYLTGVLLEGQQQ